MTKLPSDAPLAYRQGPLGPKTLAYFWAQGWIDRRTVRLLRSPVSLEALAAMVQP